MDLPTEIATSTVSQEQIIWGKAVGSKKSARAKDNQNNIKECLDCEQVLGNVIIIV